MSTHFNIGIRSASRYLIEWTMQLDGTDSTQAAEVTTVKAEI